MIKSIVVYFSHTGNTKKIAQAIHTGMKQVLNECDITKLKEIDARDLIKYDLIGLGSPAWRLKEPPNVQAFIHDMPSMEGKLCFTFCTHGCTPADYMERVVSALKRKGLTVIGFKDWYGSCFLPYLPKPYLTDGHPDEIDLKEAEDFGREMADLGQRISSGETNLIPKLPKGSEWYELYPHFVSGKGLLEIRKKTQRQMKINLGKCKYPECTLCVDNCPMNNIDFSVSPPIFKNKCALDFFCEQICPTGAIEADYGPLTRAHDINVRERFIKVTNEAEAKGRFRRLIPLDKIGWSTHQYESTRRPRIVIPK